MREGKPIPAYFTDRPIFYAGPTDPAPGEATGAFGPTTASRMDGYLEPFMKKRASLVTIAKGGRGKEAQAAIAAAGGVYLACVGGAAAITARDHVTESRIVDHADLGMEAVRLVRLKKLPALVVIDAHGSNFYA
jgi:fumarate hydratase class I